MENTPAVPVDQQRTADALLSGLGGFWTRVYADTDFVRDYCKGSGELAAQAYLEFLEASAMLGLPEFPVFKRERVLPMPIRRSQRNLTEHGNLYLGRPGITMGPQDSPDYYPGTTFHLGGSAMPINVVGYPISGVAMAAQLGHICNNLMLPTTVLARNVDYWVENNVLLINAEHDPFEHLDLYAHRTVFNPETGTDDMEIMLWLTDVLYDREWMSQLYGRIIGHQQVGSEIYYNQLMALWDLRVSDCNLARVRTSLARLFGVAAIQGATETVEAMAANADGSLSVSTDLNVYQVGPDEQLLSGIAVGTELHHGDYLTETLRLYTSLDTRRFYASNKLTLAQFLQDVPRLYIPKSMVGVPGMRFGFTPNWENVDLVYEGDTVGGRPKLKFDLAMDAGDQTVYWDAVWAACDTQGVNLIEALAEFISNTHPTIPGTVVGKINPMKFYMDNFLGVNLSVLVVDFDAISAYITSLEQLVRLEALLPAHIMMLMVLRTTVDDEEYDLGTARDRLDTGYGKRLAVEDMDITSGPEGLQTRWVRQCR